MASPRGLLGPCGRSSFDQSPPWDPTTPPPSPDFTLDQTLNGSLHPQRRPTMRPPSTRLRKAQQLVQQIVHRPVAQRRAGEAARRALMPYTTRYTEIATRQPAISGSLYFATNGEPDIAEYTSVIVVTRRRSGFMYFRAPRGMLIVMHMTINEFGRKSIVPTPVVCLK